MGSQYDTCEKTYATLRVYSDDTPATAISALLRLTPSSTLTKGEPTDKSAKRPVFAKRHGWFLSSKSNIDSPDSRDHIDWLLEQLLPNKAAIEELLSSGCDLNISCYWLSKSGHGGPTLSPDQLAGLAELGLDFWYDFYS